MKLTPFMVMGAMSAAILVSTSASAATVTADFRAELDLPSFSIGPRVFERTDENVAGAPDLTDTDEVSNPDGFGGHVDMDLTGSGLLTLTGRQPEGFADYELAIFTVSDIVFDSAQVITGVSIGVATLLDPGFDVGVVAPTISFGSNSFSITYDAGGSGSFEFLNGGISTFQIETSAMSAVPLPAGLPLLLAGVGAFGLLRRKRAA